MSAAGIATPTGFDAEGSRGTWTTVLLRHAHALDKRSWERPDEDRPLSDWGRAQSVALADQLSELSIGRVLSSPRLRCRQTVGPLAQRLAVDVQECAVLDRDAEPGELARFLDGMDPGTAVLCTHGETLTALLTYWRTFRRVIVSAGRLDMGITEKSAAWVVERGVGQLRTSYLPPPRTGTR